MIKELFTRQHAVSTVDMMKELPLSLIFNLCVVELGNKITGRLVHKVGHYNALIKWFTGLCLSGCNCIIILPLVITKISNGTLSGCDITGCQALVMIS